MIQNVYVGLEIDSPHIFFHYIQYLDSPSRLMFMKGELFVIIY